MQLATLQQGGINLAQPVNRSHPLNRGLVAWYLSLPGDGRKGFRWLDLCGRHHGTLTNMDPATGRVGAQGRPGGFGAIRFSTSNNTNRVQSASASALPTSASAAWAFSFWHRTAANASLSQYFGFGVTLPNSDDPGKNRYCLNFNSNYYWWGDARDWDTGIAFDADNTWHHVLFTTPGGSATPTISLYVDGTFRASGSPSGSLTTAGTTITAGSAHSSGASSPNASIDDCCIFNRHLSASEIRARHDLSRRGDSGMLSRVRRYWLVPEIGGTGPAGVSGCVQWLDVDALTGFADDDPVSQADDASGSGKHFTQATAGEQPLYKTNVINGKPVLRFDGSDDGMTSSLTLNPSLTMFVVYARKGGASNQRAIAGSNNWLIGPYSSEHRFYNGGFLTGPAFVLDEFVIAHATEASGGNAEFFVGNASIGTRASSAGGPGTVTIGGGEGLHGEELNGDIAEVISYNRVLTAQEQQDVYDYLSAKYFDAGGGGAAVPIISHHYRQLAAAG